MFLFTGPGALLVCREGLDQKFQSHDRSLEIFILEGRDRFFFSIFGPSGNADLAS